MIRLTVDGREIEARQGESLLHACLDNGIYIPNLCSMKGMAEFPASCRLCFVEIEGKTKPVTSCNMQVKEGLVVRTDTEAVRRLQKTGLRLLLSAHDADCRNCPSNRKCELQRMVKLLGVRLRPRRLEHITRETTLEQDHPYFDYLPARCVLCGKCVYVCRKRNGRSLLTFAKRGFDTVISCFGEEDPAALPCSQCMECVSVCPVSAILPKKKHEYETLPSPREENP